MIKVVSFDLGKTLIKPVIQNSGLCKYIADNLKSIVHDNEAILS